MAIKTTTTKKSSTPSRFTSQTVSFNPKTGAKLKAGESVSVNGKTFTQGSTNIGGTSSATKPTLSSGSKSSSSGSKAGVIKTIPAQSTGYSTAPAKTSGMSVAKPGNVTPNAINSTKSNVVKYPSVAVPKTSTFGNTFAGGLLKNIAGGASTLFSGAKSAVNKFASTASQYGGASVSGALEGSLIRTPESIAAITTPTGLPTTTFGKAKASLGISPMEQPTPDALTPKNMTLADGSGVIDNGEFKPAPNMSLNQNMSVAPSGRSTPGTNNAVSRSSSSSSALDTPVTTQKTTMTNADGSLTETSTVGAARSAPVSYNPNVVVNATNTVSMLTDSINKSRANPLNTYNQKGDIIKYTDTALSTLARDFTTPEAAITEYNTNPDFKKQVDTMTQQTGKTINDVATKITPVTNGITAPQTTSQYLSGGPAALKGLKDSTNAILSEEQQYAAKQAQAMNAELETQKTENKSLIEFYEKQEMKRETSEREKAKFAIDKAKAQFEAEDAETEQQRMLATDNLKNFLAKIGALSTDGAAGVGLANLEQRYQAQRSALKSSFNLAKREIEINMNDRLNTLEDAKDEKVFKLNQDLSKSEREINLDVMKLNHEFNKDVLEAKLKYSEAIRVEKNRASSKARAASTDWLKNMFTTVASDNAYSMFNDLPAAFKQSWIANNAGATPNGTKTSMYGNKGLANDYAAWSKNQVKEEKAVTNVEIEQTINKSMNEPAWNSASKKEKESYIRTLGANPSDYEL